MLVLSRKLGEKIQIGADIEIQVVHLDHGKCRLGITAPLTTPIMRTELLAEGQTVGEPTESEE